ncbi:endonuclease domain-containing 1 protein-like [Pholidichthys leucotaenia]
MQSSVTAFFILLLVLPLSAEVVDNFRNCIQNFYNRIVPGTKPSTDYRQICQIYENSYCFATLYDTRNKIPVYSAYVLDGNGGGGGPVDFWMVEPQVVKKNLPKYMMTAGDLVEGGYQVTMNEIKEKQAVDEDYIDAQRYDRGHMNPRGHNGGVCRDATNTLTNIVPQFQELNRGEWSQYEERLKRIAQQGGHEVFVLVGAIRSSNNFLKNRVNIPEYVWNAYCDYSSNSNAYASGAVVAKNDKNKLYDLGNDKNWKALLKLSGCPDLIDSNALTRLESFLRCKNQLTGKGKLFDQRCYPKTG